MNQVSNNAGSRPGCGLVLALVIAILPPAAAHAQSKPAKTIDALREQIRQRFEKDDLPSLQVGIVQGDKLVLHETHGLADREEHSPARPDTLYYIGSITKVFTATALVALRDQGVVALDDPVAKHLPASVKLPTDPRGAPAITLRHLATHSSGLPRVPNNLRPIGGDPYGGYPTDAMYEALARIGLEYPTGADLRYSNLGFGLLGHALERAAGTPYHELMEKHIFRPLEMRDTRVKRDSKPEKRLATGYLGNSIHVATDHWDLGSLAPAGAIVSTLPDLARFASLQFRAGQADAKPLSGGSLTEMHSPQRLTKDWRRGVGLGWFVEPHPPHGDFVGHNGATFGFTSNLTFSPRHEIAVIVLTNCGKQLDDLAVALLVDAISLHQRTSQAELDPRLPTIAEKLATNIVDPVPDAVGELFSDAFLKEVNLQAIKAVLGRIAKENGRCTGVAELRPTGESRKAEVTLQFEGGKTVRCVLEISVGEPPKIVGLFFPPP